MRILTTICISKVLKWDTEHVAKYICLRILNRMWINRKQSENAEHAATPRGDAKNVFLNIKYFYIFF